MNAPGSTSAGRARPGPAEEGRGDAGGLLERRYLRLLHAYPAGWRAENADAVLGTLLDAADAEGRERPARAETAALVTEGLAQRLDRRTAIGSAVAAMIAAVLGAVVLLFFPTTIAEAGLGWVGTALTVLLAPTGAVVALAALLRSTYRIGARGALLATVLAAPTAIAAFTAVTLWSLAFEAADRGRDVGPAADVVMVGSLVVAWILGSVALGVLARPVFGAGVGGTLGGGVAAVVATPFVGYAFLSPMTSVGMTAAVVVVALVGGRRPAERRPAESGSPLVEDGGGSAAPPFVHRPPSRTVGLVLAVTAVLGLAAVAVALTGSLWLAGIDGTEAMNVGLGLGNLVASVTVGSICLGFVRSGRLTRTAAVAAALSPAVGGAGQVLAPSGMGDAWAAIVVGSAFAGIAVAVVTDTALRRGYPTSHRVLVTGAAVLTGAGYAATVGLMIALYLPFIAPVLAGLLSWRERRGGRGVETGVAPIAPTLRA